MCVIKRVMKNSAKLAILHEPFTDAYYFGPNRRSDRYGERSDVGCIFDRAEIETIIRHAPDGRRRFVKELAFQGEPYVSDALLQEAVHLFITRHPGAVYSSLIKLKPDFTEDELGFQALQRIHRRIRDVGGSIAMVIDGDAFRAEPEATVRAACRAIDIHYDPTMLHWSDGRIRDWRPGEEKSQAVWHDTLENSSTILKPIPAPHATDVLPLHKTWYDRALDIYQRIVSKGHTGGS